MKSSSSKFVFGKSYNREVKSMLSIEGDIDVAVAFIGSGADKWLCSKKSKYRLIINLSSGATNPIEIRKMQKRKHFSIKQLDSLHAKVFISDTATIIGSANLSANGVGLEGSETSSLEEAGIVTSTSNDIREWFDDLWNKSKKISEEDLSKAQEKWIQRRSMIKKKTNENLSTVLAYAELRDLLDNANRFFVCNTNRRWSNKAEEEMCRRGYAAAWGTFKYQKYRDLVKQGDAIFMYAKRVGIIGIGRARSPFQILKSSAPDRIVNRSEIDAPEWRIPVDWLYWVKDADALKWPSPNATFFDVTKDRKLRTDVRKRFS